MRELEGGIIIEKLTIVCTYCSEPQICRCVSAFSDSTLTLLPRLKRSVLSHLCNKYVAGVTPCPVTTVNCEVFLTVRSHFRMISVRNGDLHLNIVMYLAFLSPSKAEESGALPAAL